MGIFNWVQQAVCRPKYDPIADLKEDHGKALIDGFHQ
jgi:hypothetical protein